eukprot:m.215738 g.215738  ORF g.215738 m.215738 type:complete len:584 (+) comp25629_c0_seq1:75-1826(+)
MLCWGLSKTTAVGVLAMIGAGGWVGVAGAAVVDQVHGESGVSGGTATLGVWSLRGYRAFSCDTVNGTIGGNVVSAVGFPTLRGPGCPDGAGPTADPLGPCFTPPMQVKAALDLLPQGGRALTLEAGPGMYYLFDPNATANRWGGMGDMYYMDTLPGAGRVQGPWADVWATAIRNRFDTWFGELKKLGADVDVVLCDFEMGGHSSSYDWAHQPTVDGSDPVDALLIDPRWPALQATLNAVGKAYGVEFDSASMKAMATWTSRDWRMHVWGQVVTTDGVATLLNSSIYRAIAAHYPNVRFSNFAHLHHTDPSGVVVPSTAHGLWPYAGGAIGLGAHVGTHQSRGFYGETNTTRVIAAQTPGPDGRQTELTGSSFASLLVSVVTARDMVRAAPDTPVHPWLAPKEGDWGAGLSYLSSGNASTDEVFMWEENVFHLALSTATVEFLWWQPGAQKPVGVGQPLLSRALAELDWVTGLATHGGSAECTLRPISANTTDVDSWAPTFLLSGVTITCSDGYSREVYRFTPRCTRTVWCTWFGSAYPPRNGTVSPSWRIGSGWNLSPVPSSVVLLAESPVSTAGAWLIRDTE